LAYKLFYKSSVEKGTRQAFLEIISPIIKANFPFRIVLRLAGAGDEKVMDCKGARRLIPPGDALANLKGDWERIHVAYFDVSFPVL